MACKFYLWHGIFSFLFLSLSYGAIRHNVTDVSNGVISRNVTGTRNGVLRNKPTRDFECGALVNGNDVPGLQFSLKDQDQSNNLVDDTEAGDSGWNLTTSAHVKKDCKIKICNDTYLTGSCRYLESGTHMINKTFSSSIVSVFCGCKKQCKCSDVHIKKFTCARGYIKGSCKTCNQQYADLVITSARKNFFQQFSTNVKALKLRAGCALTVYPKQHLESNEDENEKSVISQEITENFNLTIGSYKCVCNDDLYVARPKPPRPKTYPTFVAIPNDMNDVVKKLGTSEFKDHLGLHAARRSYHNKRSSRNAYVLLLGSTGAGKSSAINLLFDRPDLTKVGGTKSTTSMIHEFRIPIAVDELGISNSELRVIDTPGMGDTRGLTQDAKYLATLENYLETHEELRHRIPNVVLIFHKFNDNRFEGEGAKFVEMLRGLDTFRKQITDDDYSNVVFVFSHYMSITKTEQRKPDDRIKNFTRVIQDYTLFPKPTHLVVAENKGFEEELPMTNGFFELPNKDYYPKNLFAKIDLITEKCGDPIGQGVIRTAFRDSENFNISRIDFPLMSSNSTRAQQYLGVLNNANLDVKDTVISKKLQVTWNTKLDQNLKKQYPFSLAYLQKALNLRNINNLADIPRTTSKVLELVTALKHDAATRSLLEQGLGIQAPVFPQDTVVGHGYHIFQDRPLTTSPLQLGELKHSDIGFRIPSSISCNIDPDTKKHLLIFEDMTEYINYRFQSLGIDGNSSVDEYKGEVQPGCNVRALTFRQDGCNVSATKDFRLFELVLNDKVSLHRDFNQTVQQLSPVNTSDYESVKQWEDFFDKYGTHVVKSAYGGGSIHVNLQSNQPFGEHVVEAIFNLVKFAEDLTYEIEYVKVDLSERNTTIPKHENTSSSQYTTFIGGDPNFHTTDFGKMSIIDASNLLSNWKRSLRLSPAMLQSEMRLVPISRLARGLGHNYTAEIEKATQLLFKSNLKYKPSSKTVDNGPGASRDDTPLAQEMRIMMQENSKQMQSWMFEIKKMEQENQKKRLELEEKRINWEEKSKLMEANSKQEMLRMQLQGEKDRQAHEEKLQKMRQDHANDMWQKSKEKAGGCLKADTLVLMASGREKRVDELKIGDVILDMELRPTKVLGVAREFMLGNRFYGFSRNGPFFFTSNHLFVGRSQIDATGNDLQLFAKSTSDLYMDNPLMVYLNIKEFEKSTKLLHLQNSSIGLKLGEKIQLNVYEDLSEYSEDTIMYDIQVDSSSGTYFANGFVCRHEIPPIEHWPNTMSLLFRLLESPVFEIHLPKMSYTVDNVYKWHNAVDSLVKMVKNYIISKKWQLKISMEDTENTEKQEFISLKNASPTESISRLFKSPTVSTVALRLYSRLGLYLAPWLDQENEFVMNPAEAVLLRNHLYEIITLKLDEIII